MLRDAGMQTAVIDTNIDTVRSLASSKRPAIYGDATRRDVLEQAGVPRAVHLIVTLPHTEGRAALVMAARELSPTINIAVRARYLAERDALARAGANAVVYEEGEAGLALARHVLEHRQLPPQQIDQVLSAVRKVWLMQP